MWWYLLACELALGAPLVMAALWAVQHVPRWEWTSSTVLLTGGSAGIGLSTAEALARKRVPYLVLAARREAVLQEAVQQVKGVIAQCGSPTRVSYIVMDVSDEASVATGVAQATVQCDGHRINLLICNAGFAYPARFVDSTMQNARQMMEVNYFGCLNVVWKVLPDMLSAKRGRVVFTSSMVARAPIAGYTLYSATKAGLRAFAHSLDMENSCLGVRVQVVSPPDVETPGYAHENEVKSPECAAISAFGGATPFSSAAMAEAIVRGIEDYTFDITLGSDGALLNYGCAGIEPATSVCALLVQCTIAGLLRLGLAVLSKLHYGIVKRVRVTNVSAEARKAEKRD
ncbi:putative mitochondrial Short chain dehydrogenase [Leptomonas pyrrhocoris]|uniref:3-dehydrosphinganine reductase n=1 Tax=Leptomonas pyrrhocoris TaxID=157538 RepID=A0A0M9GA19_LEPPY|nr:putative mitochondrial Short chain dehydrogenase [Leptomonas pyrrhocoris]KPA85887.1 putative mitochondrial Short chain dehydrogenase [Leptomonas pyrrhocoris]|eukprot:XP_015664326.1 putative mitochondrial Short chain dehydrogenase [Leptomonas pyrrhocoris]